MIKNLLILLRELNSNNVLNVIIGCKGIKVVVLWNVNVGRNFVILVGGRVVLMVVVVILEVGKDELMISFNYPHIIMHCYYLHFYIFIIINTCYWCFFVIIITPWRKKSQYTRMPTCRLCSASFSKVNSKGSNAIVQSLSRECASILIATKFLLLVEISTARVAKVSLTTHVPLSIWMVLLNFYKSGTTDQRISF